jgi:two-component system, response regulator
VGPSRNRLDPARTPAAMRSGVRLNSKTILLVEDNPSDIALTRRALEKARIANALTVAEDGQEALDYLLGAGAHAGRDTSNQPALTLLDLKLPKIPGLEVLRRIRAEALTRRLPVVILTSSDEEQDVARSYDLGINSYIRKPVDFRQFAQAVEQLGLYWLVLNEPPPEGARRPAP